MKPLFKNLVTPLRGTFLTLLLTVPQIPVGSLSSQKALAQQTPSCPAGTRLVNLNWTQANFQPGNFNQTLNLNGVNINFRMVENPAGIIKDESPQNSPGGLGAVPYGIAPGIYGGINKPYLRWGIDARGANRGGNATLIITADRPIILGSPVLFLDVDRDRTDELVQERGFQDQITVTASNAGVNVPVILTPSAFNEVVGNVARGKNPRVGLGNAEEDTSSGNVAADFAGPVTTIQVVYESGPLYALPNPGPGQDETIGIATDISVCVSTAVGSIGDTVFNDRNGNNVQDTDEPGIPGVEVQIKDGNGNVVNTATTDTNGKYRVPNLAEGQYTASVANPPNGFSPTLTQPNPITLTAGQNYDLADFGFLQPTNASIGDTVFNDINDNGQQDAEEPGIPNVTVNLTRPGNDGILGNGDDTSQTATTNPNGIYNFNNLPAGNYRVTVTPPANLPQITTGNPQVDVNLQPNQSITNVDFGFRRPGSGAAGDGDIFLVKRITAIASTNGQAIQYNTFVDDPNDQNDNTLSPGAVGQYQAPTPVQSGDEVEYTIYFRTDQSLENINLCDLVPAGTTYVPNSISVTGGGTGADQGRFFPPLTPIEQIPESSFCENRNNPNGTVIVKLGNIPTTQSGFVRFRVKVD
jgi:uncharacterized repeat protein (TIGR01451 family)